MRFSADQAEILAIKVLGWLAANDELMPVFLGASGASLSDLRDRAADPLFLGAILDFVMMDDAWVVAFCDQEGLAYSTVEQARAALPGGELIHWT